MNVALLDARATAATQPRFVIDEEHVDATSPDGKTLAVVVNPTASASSHDVAHRAREKPRPRCRPGRSRVIPADGGRWCSGSRASAPDEVFASTCHHLRRAPRHRDHAGLDESALVEPTIERDAELRRRRGARPPPARTTSRPASARPWWSTSTAARSQFTPYFSPVIQYPSATGTSSRAPNVRGLDGLRQALLPPRRRRAPRGQRARPRRRQPVARGCPDDRFDRIAVFGGSHGGYMVLAALTLQPEPGPPPAATVAGIANFRTFPERAPLPQSARPSTAPSRATAVAVRLARPSTAS